MLSFILGTIGYGSQLREIWSLTGHQADSGDIFDCLSWGKVLLAPWRERLGMLLNTLQCTRKLSLKNYLFHNVIVTLLGNSDPTYKIMEMSFKLTSEEFILIY